MLSGTYGGNSNAGVGVAAHHSIHSSKSNVSFVAIVNELEEEINETRKELNFCKKETQILNTEKDTVAEMA